MSACSISCKKWSFFTFGRKDVEGGCDGNKCDCICQKVEKVIYCKIRDLPNGDLYLSGRGKDGFEVYDIIH